MKYKYIVFTAVFILIAGCVQTKSDDNSGQLLELSSSINKLQTQVSIITTRIDTLETKTPSMNDKPGMVSTTKSVSELLATGDYNNIKRMLATPVQHLLEASEFGENFTQIQTISFLRDKLDNSEYTFDQKDETIVTILGYYDEYGEYYNCNNFETVVSLNENSFLDSVALTFCIENGKITQIRETGTLRLFGFATNGEGIPAYCSDEPVDTEIGRIAYPIKEAYAHLPFLGQLFTAAECGDDRLSNIFGLDGDNYTLGSMIVLTGDPAQGLIDSLKSLDFTCDDGNPETSCHRWKLSVDILMKDLLKLEPYHKEFQEDDCTHCG
jgi:outer membrane murein-binding lipoprotein Lpp